MITPKSIFCCILFSSIVLIDSSFIANNIETVFTNQELALFRSSANSTYIIKKDIDLHGRSFEMPEGVTIVAKKGVIKNGTIIGNRNTIIQGKYPVFDNVTILGEWNVPNISTSMFKNLNYDNSLRDVLALTNPAIRNIVEIKDGCYRIKIEKSGGFGIVVEDNTTLVINGSLILTPNEYSNYDIILVQGKNINISGNGVIVGDKRNHNGTLGEWGMGIDILQSENVNISNLTIMDCWGDCIYVGDDSESVIIRNCKIDNGRRQGISVTSGNNIVINNCEIMNIGGTNPEYGIDIEPNTNNRVGHVAVDCVSFFNCKGCLLVWGKAKGSIIESVVVSNCVCQKPGIKTPFSFNVAKSIVIDGCIIDSGARVNAIYTEGIETCEITNNHIYTKHKQQTMMDQTINVRNPSSAQVKNNTISNE